MTSDDAQDGTCAVTMHFYPPVTLSTVLAPINSRLPIQQRFERLPHPKKWQSLFRYRHHFPAFWIATVISLIFATGKCSETSKLDAVAMFQCGKHRIKYAVDHQLRLILADVTPFRDGFNEFGFGHWFNLLARPQKSLSIVVQPLGSTARGKVFNNFFGKQIDIG